MKATETTKELVKEVIEIPSKPNGAFDQEKALNWSISITIDHFDNTARREYRSLDSLKRTTIICGVRVFNPDQYILIENILNDLKVYHCWHNGFYCNIETDLETSAVIYSKIEEATLHFNVGYTNCYHKAQFTWK